MVKKSRTKCRLLPYTKKEVLTAQDAGDRAGWQITAFNLPEVWKKCEGEGVVIGICDSGCDYNHPDLKGNILNGFNFINNTDDPMDDAEHGTFCSSLLCSPKNGYGIIGVAPKAKVIPIKVLDADGCGEMENVAKGIKYAIDRKCDIISMSLGCAKPIQQVRKAIQLAMQNNIPVFCAAGNAGNMNEIFFPAAYPETIAVGAIDKTFHLASFSNSIKNSLFDRNIDFLAPGVDILAATPGNNYAVMSGTSFATPFAVGVAALLLSHRIAIGEKEMMDSIDEYRSELKKYSTGIDSDTLKNKLFAGFGIIDPRKIII